MESEINDMTAKELSEASCETSKTEMHSRIFMALQVAEKRGEVLANYRHDNTVAVTDDDLMQRLSAKQLPVKPTSGGE